MSKDDIILTLIPLDEQEQTARDQKAFISASAKRILQEDAARRARSVQSESTDPLRAISAAIGLELPKADTNPSETSRTRGEFSDLVLKKFRKLQKVVPVNTRPQHPSKTADDRIAKLSRDIERFLQQPLIRSLSEYTHKEEPTVLDEDDPCVVPASAEIQQNIDATESTLTQQHDTLSAPTLPASLPEVLTAPLSDEAAELHNETQSVRTQLFNAVQIALTDRFERLQRLYEMAAVCVEYLLETQRHNCERCRSSPLEYGRRHKIVEDKVLNAAQQRCSVFVSQRHTVTWYQTKIQEELQRIIALQSQLTICQQYLPTEPSAFSANSCKMLYEQLQSPALFQHLPEPLQRMQPPRTHDMVEMSARFAPVKLSAESALAFHKFMQSCAYELKAREHEGNVALVVQKLRSEDDQLMARLFVTLEVYHMLWTKWRAWLDLHSSLLFTLTPFSDSDRHRLLLCDVVLYQLHGHDHAWRVLRSHPTAGAVQDALKVKEELAAAYGGLLRLDSVVPGARPPPSAVAAGETANRTATSTASAAIAGAEATDRQRFWQPTNLMHAYEEQPPSLSDKLINRGKQLLPWFV
eukprot:TRINITY_DN6626_c0_g1_i1.p1 TRINITY_DN6626_c0_g1~~TRINITY_DN6626_c0_g1_i1.p1  ORF type:complete len:582 (+),score=104.42 TRINITY_DN6626_c0_g1_i1:65-1810(+)